MVILKRKYLELIVSGCKRVECRLTRTRRAPFGQVACGDRLLLKESCGPIRAEAAVSRVEFLGDLDSGGLAELERRYDGQIMGGRAFWDARRECRYCSLIWLEAVREVRPWRIRRRGMDAWVVYRQGAGPQADPIE